MIDVERFRPRTVAAQLTAVVVGAVLFGVTLASALMFYLLYSGGVGPSRDTLVQVRAARIAAVVNGVLEARRINNLLPKLSQRHSTAPLATHETVQPRAADAKTKVAALGLRIQFGGELFELARWAARAMDAVGNFDCVFQVGVRELDRGLLPVARGRGFVLG